MRRRQVLSLAAAVALPLAGCVDAPGRTATETPATPSDRRETPSSTESTTASEARTLRVGESHEFPDGTTVTVRAVRVRKLVRSTSVGSSTHIDVACLADHQFAVVDAAAIDADGTSVLSDLQFALAVDGTEYPLGDRHQYWAFPPGTYDRPGVPAIPVPVADATGAAVVLRRDGNSPVRWTVPSGTVGSLGRAPSFAVRSFDVPDVTRRDRSVEAAFTVANTGDRDGRFTAEFGAGPISDHDEVTLRVPAGAERTHTATLDPYYTEERDEVEVTLAWGCDRLRRTVPVDA